MFKTLFSAALLIFSLSAQAQQVIVSPDNLPEYNTLIREIGYQVDFDGESKQIEAKYVGQRAGITFTGSSTMTRWLTLAEDFPGLRVRKMGIGGASLKHIIAHGERLVFANRPDTVVLYIGDNDVMNYDLETFKRYFEGFRSNLFHRLPQVKLIVLSIKYSPDRTSHWEAYRKINTYLAGIKGITYVDFSSDMSSDNDAYFLEDGLHLNRKGYDLIIRKLAPLLYSTN